MISSGRPVRAVAESLGVGENLIYRWRSRLEPKGTLGRENGSVPTDQQALLRRIRELEMERDMDPMLTHVCWSKKALAIFSRQT